MGFWRWVKKIFSYDPPEFVALIISLVLAVFLLGLVIVLLKPLLKQSGLL